MKFDDLRDCMEAFWGVESAAHILISVKNSARLRADLVIQMEIS